MKFSELMRRVQGRGVVVLEARAGADVLGVCEDSRKVKAGDVFVARAGTRADGSRFVADAVARGAVAVVAAVEGLNLPECVAFARVENVNLACALLAHETAGNPTAEMKVIGITGTKGKTTVAYLLRSVLQAAGHKVGMIGTVEIDDGEHAVAADMTTPGAVELAALFARMKANGVTHCVMEVSSHALHQHRVAGIEFAVGVFTNLTGDHLDYHHTMEEYAAAKALLFQGLSDRAVAVINAADPWAERMVKGAKARVACYRAFQSGAGNEADTRWSGEITAMAPGHMVVHIVGPGTRAPLHTGLIGRHNASNLMAAFVAAAEAGVEPEIIHRALRAAQGAPGRLQSVTQAFSPRVPFHVFVDYAHTHDALDNVLTSIRATMGSGRLICVFGCGGDRDRTKRPKMGAVAERLADRVIVTSDNPRTEEPRAIIDEICAGLTAGWNAAGKVTVEADRRAAIQAAVAMAERGDVVLIAGKGHENYQIVGTTKHHFDDVEEATAALTERCAAKVCAS